MLTNSEILESMQSILHEEIENVATNVEINEFRGENPRFFVVDKGRG